MRIHLIILITQLKSIAVIVTRVSDRYERKVNIKSSFVYNEGDEIENKFEVDKIMNKRITREKPEYLFK